MHVPSIILKFYSVHSIFADVGEYVFDPKADSSSNAAKGAYFDQPAREKEPSAKGEHVN